MEKGFNQKETSDRSNEVNFKRVIASCLRYWYVFLISIIIAIATAFLVNRYSVRLYTVNMSILIRENKENIGAADILYNNPLIQSYRNFYNEIYLLKSYPLVESTILELHLPAKIIGEGNIQTVEFYNSKIKVEILNPDSARFFNQTFKLEILSSEEFSLISNNYRETFRFNEPFNLNGLKLVFLLKDTTIDSFNDINYYFSITRPDALITNYINRIKIDWAEEGASVINLSIGGSTPKKEEDFLNTLVKNYAERDLKKKNLAASRSLEFIEHQLDKISDSLQIYENKLVTFQEQNMITNLSDEGSRAYGKLSGLEERLSEIKIQENYFQYLIDYLESMEDTDDLVVLPSSVGIQDPVLNTLLNRLLHLQMQRNNYSQQGNQNNPLYNRVTTELIQLKEDILKSIKNASSALQVQEKALQRQTRLIEDQIAVLPALERRLIGIRRIYNLNENIFIFLSQKHAETGISKAATTSDVDVINPARVTGPISPKTNRNYIIAFVLGLTVPIGFFVLREILNNKIQSKEDLEALTDISFLGGVGHSIKFGNLVILKKPKGIIAESFRAIRSNLNYFAKGKEQNVYMITSSISGEGKTFVSLNLATILAFSNKNVVIIGADMRRPRIFNDFNLSNDKGLSTYLSDPKIEAEEVIQKTPISSLDIISGGPVPPNPSELLMDDRMKLLIKELKRNYDYIIIDTPPINIVADAMEIIDLVDHTIFLVRQGYTPKKAIEQVNDLYKTNQIKNISLVLNDIKKSGLGYGYGYGGYGYGYGYGYKSNNGYYEET